MRMGRAGGLLVDGTAEDHLRIGALEDAGDAGAPLELLLDDRPDGLMSMVNRRSDTDLGNTQSAPRDP